MPGIYGAVGHSPSVFDELKKHFDRVQGPSNTIALGNARLGVYAHGRYFPLEKPIADEKTGLAVALDGYILEEEGPPDNQTSAEECILRAARRLRDATAWTSEDRPEGVFNLAVFEEGAQRLFIACGEGGLFPLYYRITPEGFVFSSFLRPLVSAVPASVDTLGVAERFTLGWEIGARTVYQSVNRLLPGERLVYDAQTNRLSRQCDVSGWGTVNGTCTKAGLIDEL